MTTGGDILSKAADLFKERNKQYNDNYIRLGRAMSAMFPNGLLIETAEDWTRLYFFLLVFVKFSRYATVFKKFGHPDSSIDACVYAAMLHAYDKDLPDGTGLPD